MMRFRGADTAKKIIDSLQGMKLNLELMHVCGTHQDTLVKYGLEEMLAKAGVVIHQGPGCPVCVTTTKEIVEGITLARAGVPIAVFGDMMTVPTPIGSLADAKAEGAEVKIVYSVEDATKLATSKEVVFMSIGFETTSPTTASVMLAGPPAGFSALSCHRILPPALDALFAMGEVRIDGLIQPGHVATIIGLGPFHRFSTQYNVPQVVAGFEPLDVLMAVHMIARQTVDGRAEVENEYSRVVRPEGNPIAAAMLEKVFKTVDKAWRGFPVIPQSALEFRPEFDAHNARIRYADILKDAPVVKEEMGGCRCGEVLRGLIRSEQCPAFGKSCSPKRPMGPCMVSREGSCSIAYRYRKE